MPAKYRSYYNPDVASPTPTATARPWVSKSVVVRPDEGPASLTRLKDLSEVKHTSLVNFGTYSPGASSRSRSIKLVAPAAMALAGMVDAARSAGIPQPLLEPISGFRSPARQLELWKKAVSKYGSEAAARKWVAPPGHSTHQTGRAVDLDLGEEAASQAAERSRNTAAWKWLNAHASAFGFAPYPPEPWHWEFVDLVA